MMGDPLSGRRVVLGVSGGIAAYKAIEVCRRLVEAGAHVVPVLTEGALHFVGATTFSALASEPAQTSLWTEDAPIPHTRLGQSADLIIVAPATARVLSAYAAGYSHDLLTNALIATRAPVLVAPAMHTEMWEHPATVDNLEVLRRRGVGVVGPGVGRLAGGDSGAGRLADPAEIVDAARRMLEPSRQDLVGCSVLVTAGGTREPIDPVRFLGNRSSGKQGHAIAEAAARRGAKVTLVTTTSLPVPTGIERVVAETAQELHDAVLPRSATADVVIMAAAVADFTPVTVADSKLKKRDGIPAVELRPTVDVLAALGAAKQPGQILVGFAAETTNLEANAIEKLHAKRADLLVANDVSRPGVGFEHETNAVTILAADGGRRAVPLASKAEIADAVVEVHGRPVDSAE